LVVERQLDPGTPGFLQLRRSWCRVDIAGGAETDAFAYDVVTRRHPDAVVVAAHFEHHGRRHVYLRSCVRPPLSVRQQRDPRFTEDGNLWELPAGMIEEAGDPLAAARQAAVREVHEELGFELAADQFRELGPAILPIAGLMAEKQYLLEVEVEPTRRGVPLEDGPLEQAGAVIEIAVADALQACAEGAIPDAKTELGLRRLAELCPDRK
jgi:ADP-ribose pyrophosphatase